MSFQSNKYDIKMEAKKEIFLQAWCSLAMCQLLMCTIELKKMEFKKIIGESVWEQAWHHNFVLVSQTNPLRGAGQSLSFLFE